MVKKKKKERRASPMSMAGLLTFYQEDIKGIKIRPIYVVITAVGLVTAVMLAHLGLLVP